MRVDEEPLSNGLAFDAGAVRETGVACGLTYWVQTCPSCWNTGSEECLDSCASTVYAFQGRMVDTLIAGMEANMARQSG